MKQYHFTIMSIDPDDNSEDAHQKYGITIDGNDYESAKEKAILKFNDEYGLPIFWIK